MKIEIKLETLAEIWNFINTMAWWQSNGSPIPYDSPRYREICHSWQEEAFRIHLNLEKELPSGDDWQKAKSKEYELNYKRMREKQEK